MESAPQTVKFHATQEDFQSIALSDEAQQPNSIVKRLSLLDRYLTLWIFLAMVLGVLVGYLAPSTAENINSWQSGSTNIPIAIGLILMMYPPFTRVKFEKIIQGEHGSNKLGRVFLLSLLLNWFVAPLLMFFLAMATLPDHPDYMRGVITVGIARCIAMVVIWNNLAQGSAELATVLVVLNSVFQIIMFSFLSYLFVTILPPLFGFAGSVVHVGIADVAESVAIYLGIPFFAGVLTRVAFVRAKGLAWFEREFVPRIGPLTLLALLFTIIIMFILKGSLIVTIPLDILRICVPLVVYFALVFFASFALAYHSRLSYTDACTVSFTAASNNFELAIAVAIGQFGLDSGEALATVVGPLVEVPVMLALVHVALALRRWPRLKWPSSEKINSEAETVVECCKNGQTCQPCQPLAAVAAASAQSCASSECKRAECTNTSTHTHTEADGESALDDDCRKLLSDIGVLSAVGEDRASEAVSSFSGLRTRARAKLSGSGARVCVLLSLLTFAQIRVLPFCFCVDTTQAAHKWLVNPVAVRAMQSRGIDITREFPKPVTADVAEAADIVVSMGCGDQICSRFPKKPHQKYMDWGLEDPHGKGDDVVAKIRDAIFDRVIELAKQLQCGDCGCHAL